MSNDTNPSDSGPGESNTTPVTESSHPSVRRRSVLQSVGGAAGVSALGLSATAAADDGDVSVTETEELGAWTAARTAHAVLDQNGQQVQGELQGDGLFPSLFDAHAARVQTGDAEIDDLDPIFVAIPYSGFGFGSGTGMLFSIVVEEDGQRVPATHFGLGAARQSGFGIMGASDELEINTYGVDNGSSTQIASETKSLDAQVQGDFSVQIECTICELVVDTVCQFLADPQLCNDLGGGDPIFDAICDILIELVGDFLCQNPRQGCEALGLC